MPEHRGRIDEKNMHRAYLQAITFNLITPVPNNAITLEQVSLTRLIILELLCYEEFSAYLCT